VSPAFHPDAFLPALGDKEAAAPALIPAVPRTLRAVSVDLCHRSPAYAALNGSPSVVFWLRAPTT